MDDRREIILKIADRIEENLPELGSLLSSEQGKPMEGFAGLGAMFEMGLAARPGSATPRVSTCRLR